MGTIKNFRTTADVTMNTKLKDGGVYIDWASLTEIRAWIYSDAQKALAGRVDVTIDQQDSTKAVLVYAGTKAQYPGINRLIIQARYNGSLKTYDKAVFNFVPRTAEATGNVTIDEPETDVEIVVQDVSSSILDATILAALAAADRANDAAEAAEHMVDIHQGPPGEDGKSPYIGENGHWYEWDEDAGEYVDTETEAQGETGTTPDITIGTVTTVEPGTPAAATMTGTPEAPVLNLTIPKGVAGDTPAFTVGEVTTGQPGTPVVVTITGTAAAPVLNIQIPQGLQGNTGSSVDYPFELVNNATTNDATKAATAAVAKVLKDEITQLEHITTGNLWKVTIAGGYINSSGEKVTSANHNSCQLQMIPRTTYKVVQQTTAAGGNYVRIFQLSGDTLTQVYNERTNGTDVNYTCLDDGNTYILQAIWDLRNTTTGDTEIYATTQTTDRVVVLSDKTRNLEVLTEELPSTYEKIGNIYPMFRKTANLANITSIGSRLNDNGNIVHDNYDSSLVKLDNSSTYYAHQDYKWNYFRVYKLEDGEFTQLDSTNGVTDWSYTVPATGDIYMQLVINTANAQTLKEIWLSKGSALTEWTPPYQLIETELFGDSIQQNTNDIAQNASDIAAINAEIHCPNLWEVTSENGFYNASGVMTPNNSYDSCQIENAVNGDTYRIKMQTVSSGSGNYVRVYRDDSGTLTQIYYQQQNGGTIEYTIPDDGNDYMLQVAMRKSTGDGPAPEIYDISEDLIINVQKMEERISDYRKIRILAIGNSYSRDAFMYFPFVLESMVPGVQVTFGILYKGGCTLQEHYSYISNDTDYQAFDLYRTGGIWTSEDNKNVDFALAAEDWDIILLQQRSYKSNDYSTFQPYLNDIVTLLQSKVDYNFKLGWFLTPALNDGCPDMEEATSDEMFENIVAAVQQLMDETAVEFVIPCGTAIQNARTTDLKNLGDTGGLMYDNLHLQEGIPCLIEAYVAAIVIANLMGKPTSVFGNQIRPTDAWITAHNIIQKHGSSVGVTDANCYIAQKCAAIAVKKPYEITDLTALGIV